MCVPVSFGRSIQTDLPQALSVQPLYPQIADLHQTVLPCTQHAAHNASMRDDPQLFGPILRSCFLFSHIRPSSLYHRIVLGFFDRRSATIEDVEGINSEADGEGDAEEGRDHLRRRPEPAGTTVGGTHADMEHQRVHDHRYIKRLGVEQRGSHPGRTSKRR